MIPLWILLLLIKLINQILGQFKIFFFTCINEIHQTTKYKLNCEIYKISKDAKKLYNEYMELEKTFYENINNMESKEFIVGVDVKSYTGELLNNKPHGIGKLKCASLGMEHLGKFENSISKGLGKYSKNKFHHIYNCGQFVNGICITQGETQCNIYNYVDDKRSGFCMDCIDNKSFWIGYWVDGITNGLIIELDTYPSESILNSDCFYNDFNFFGINYLGGSNDGQANGIGMSFSNNKISYYGNWNDNKKKGDGYIFDNNDILEVNYKDNDNYTCNNIILNPIKYNILYFRNRNKFSDVNFFIE